MSDVTQAQVEATLAAIMDPHLDKDLMASRAVKKISVSNGQVEVQIELGYPAKSWLPALTQQVQDKLGALPGVGAVNVQAGFKVTAHTVQKNLDLVPGVKNIIAVASGKGGVGKSTVAVNVALALSAEGAKVGILDADIYGPSQPRMLGIKGKPDSKDGRTLEPMNSYQLQAMSIGFLVDEDTPMIWRGPMVTQALEQLLKDTQWKELDYLVVDMPPGTGDTQLTLAQKVPVSGAIIVTTPQDIALLDARKGLKMFEKVEVPVLGVVENMSLHICSKCGHEEPIFGVGGGERMAQEEKVDFLGALPLDIRIREDADSGRPTVVAEPDSRVAQLYRDIARRAAARLSQRARNLSAKFPKIMISAN
jgi:ATP-binding protein involved in chromosome partitioning